MIFELGGDRALGSDVFPIAFFQLLWEETKGEVMEFVKSFMTVEDLRFIKHIGASSIVTLLIPKEGVTTN